MQCLFALSEAQRSRRCGEKHMSETVTGYIDHVIFRNEDNGYTVMVLKGTKKEEELTCVGSFPAITQGASIEATGVYIHHPVYGKQFQISSFTEKMPEDTYGIERYLGSGAIRGIGPGKKPLIYIFRMHMFYSYLMRRFNMRMKIR